MKRTNKRRLENIEKVMGDIRQPITYMPLTYAVHGDPDSLTVVVITKMRGGVTIGYVEKDSDEWNRMVSELKEKHKKEAEANGGKMQIHQKRRPPVSGIRSEW